MKTVLQTLLPVLFFLVAFSGCTHKGYDEVEDMGEWRSLGHMERDEYYVRVDNFIYGTSETDSACIVNENNPLAVDVKSFQVCKGSDYAKDGKCVFYPIWMTCVDSDSTAICNDPCYMVEYIVDGADPDSFKYLGDGYGIDRYHMYCDGEKITWDDEVIERAKEVKRALGKQQMSSSNPSGTVSSASGRPSEDAIQQIKEVYREIDEKYNKNYASHIFPHEIRDTTVVICDVHGLSMSDIFSKLLPIQQYGRHSLTYDPYELINNEILSDKRVADFIDTPMQDTLYLMQKINHDQTYCMFIWRNWDSVICMSDTGETNKVEFKYGIDKEFLSELKYIQEWRKEDLLTYGRDEQIEGYYRSNPASRCVFRFVKHSDSISIDMLKYYEPIWLSLIHI